MNNFNSIKVQLKQNTGALIQGGFNLFQFHKGTIKTHFPTALLLPSHYFNSIKVQLKLPGKNNMRSVFLIFQFHKGTIKTRYRRLYQHRRRDFNSIKVQLKPIITILMPFSSLFQFHKGTIKTNECFDVINILHKFQFHKGTIKTHCFWIYNILIFNRSCECKVKKSY